MSKYVISVAGSKNGSVSQLCYSTAEFENGLTAQAFFKELDRIKDELQFDTVIPISAIRLEDEPADFVEEIMVGDCTKCDSFMPDCDPPYQCAIHGKTSDGGCDLWAPKGVYDDD